MRMIGQTMSRLRAIGDRVLCVDGDFGSKTTKHGIIIKSTIGTSEGTTPRWFKVLEVGPEIDWIKPGEWVYVEYGRWSEGFTCNDDRLEEGQKVWLVENKACMATAEEKPENVYNISSTDQRITPFA